MYTRTQIHVIAQLKYKILHQNLSLWSCKCMTTNFQFSTRNGSSTALLSVPPYLLLALYSYLCDMLWTAMHHLGAWVDYTENGGFALHTT